MIGDTIVAIAMVLFLIPYIISLVMWIRDDHRLKQMNKR